MKRIFHSRRERVHRLICAFATISFAVTMKVWSVESNTGRLVHFREPHATRYVLIESGVTNALGRADQHWTRARLEKGDTNTVEFGSRVVLELTRGTDLSSVVMGSKSA